MADKWTEKMKWTLINASAIIAGIILLSMVFNGVEITIVHNEPNEPNTVAEIKDL